MTSARPWWIVQFVLAALCLIGAVTVFATSSSGTSADVDYGLVGAVTGGGFMPGLVLSLGLNGVVLAVRRPQLISRAGRGILIAEFAVFASLIVASVIGMFTISENVEWGLGASIFAFVAWPALVILAIVAFIVTLSGTVSASRRAASLPARSE